MLKTLDDISDWKLKARAKCVIENEDDIINFLEILSQNPRKSKLSTLIHLSENYNQVVKELAKRQLEDKSLLGTDGNYPWPTPMMQKGARAIGSRSENLVTKFKYQNLVFI